MKTTLKKYSEKEQNLIYALPQLTGLLMSSAAYSGIEGTKSELKVSVNTIFDGKIKFPDNELIHSIIPTGNTKEDVIAKIEQEQKEFIDKFRISNKETLISFRDKTLDKYRIAIHYMSKKETLLVIREFKSWLLNIAENVAVAAIEDAVFGVGGEDFSKRESEIFCKIKLNLDLN